MHPRPFFISASLILLLLVSAWAVYSSVTPAQPPTLSVLTTPTPAPPLVVTYTTSNATIPNPERGFYRHTETHASAPTLYGESELLGYQAEGVRLLYCGIYLDTFVESPISAAFLTHLQTNLGRVRAAGLKCILRFVYTDEDPSVRNGQPPFGDATKERIEEHLHQLEPLLRENADVIAHVQMGLIGVWGEWYYTDHFVDDPTNPGVVSTQQHARRREVVTVMLNALPVTRTVSVRTPAAKQSMFAPDEAIPLQARVGFHNDCFLASDTDFGTYRDDDIEADKSYMAAATQGVPMGGETCAPNSPRSDCPTALAELARFHWSYLNRGYHADVLAAWQSQGCLAEVERRLGYYLVLQRGEFPPQAASGSSLAFKLELQNTGFAAPFNPRPVELLLRHVPSQVTRSFTLAVDPRTWLPGTTHLIDGSIFLPPDLPSGDYELLLHLPDEATLLRARPEYAIRLGNDGTWEAETGYNRLLHTVTVVQGLPQDMLYLPLMRRWATSRTTGVGLGSEIEGW